MIRRVLPRLVYLSILAACSGSSSGLEVPELTYGLPSHWPSSSAYPGIGDGKIIVTNNQDDTVSVFDLDSVGKPGFAELVRVPVGLNPLELEGPHEAAIDPATGEYYVNVTNYVAGAGGGPRGIWGTGLAHGFVAKYSGDDNHLIASAEVDPSPGNSAVSADRKRLFVSHYNFATIIQVASRGGTEEEMASRFLSLDTSTMTLVKGVPLCPGAHGLRLSPDGKRAYVTCIADKIAVVDVSSADLPVQYVPLAPDPGTVIVPKYEPYTLAVSPVSSEVWVSCRGLQQVRVVKPDTLTVDMSRVVPLTGQPLFGDFNADGSLFYVATQLSDSITVIDTATGMVARTLTFPADTCQSAHQFRFTPDFHYGLALCEGDHNTIPGTLVVFDMQAGESFVTSVPVGIFPDFVGILRKGS
jgi:YVTN family beta-propeller protein